MSRSLVRSVLALMAMLAVAASMPDALAHIQLDSPTARTTQQKSGPCGEAGGTRGPDITVFEPGQTITVSWRETVNHPGHFRIAFDADGQDDFVDPQAYDDYYTNSAVLLDEIPDTPNAGPSSVQITLPDIECETCTLQLIQIMTDKPPFGDGNEFYYQCADIALRRTTAPADDPVDVALDTTDTADTADTASEDTSPRDTSSTADTSDATASTDATPSAGDDVAEPADTAMGGDGIDALEVDLDVDDPESDCACAAVRRPATPTSVPRGFVWAGLLALVAGLAWQRRRRHGEPAGRP